MAVVDKEPNLQILTEAYRAQLRDIGNGLFLTEREHNYGSQRVIIETFGPNWILGFGSLRPLQLSIRSGNRLIPIQGPQAVLVPPFSIIEWHLAGDEFKWHALSSSLPLPADLRACPRVYRWDGQASFQTPEAVLSFLKTEPIYLLREERDNSELAMKIKRHLIQHFKEELNVSELAQLLGISRVVFSRQFSKTYGIPPVHYLNQLRVYEALRLMNEGFNITESIMRCGYSSINQFIDFFKRHFSTVPSRYKIRRLKNRDLVLD